MVLLEDRLRGALGRLQRQLRVHAGWDPPLVLKPDLPSLAAASLCLVVLLSCSTSASDEIQAEGSQREQTTTTASLPTTTAPVAASSTTHSQPSAASTTTTTTLFAPEQLQAASAELWTGEASGRESAATGFLINTQGCIGLADHPGADSAWPLRIGTFGSEYVAVAEGGRAIDFNGTIIELGAYLLVGGAWRPTHATDGLSSEVLEGIRNSVEAAPASCGLVSGDQGWFFDSNVGNTPQVVDYEGTGQTEGESDE